MPIFDGKTLTGWDGDPTFWRVENGEIVGETTPEKVVKLNNFLIWRGGTVKDFELKVEFRMSGTNSGIQYRSVELPDIGKWVLKGYQADMDFTRGVRRQHPRRARPVAGRRRATSCCRGAARSRASSTDRSTRSVGDDRRPTLLRGVMNVNGWNQYHIIARGPVLMQLHQRPADGGGDRRGHQARRARRAARDSRCTSGRRSRSSTATSCIASCRSAREPSLTPAVRGSAEQPGAMGSHGSSPTPCVDEGRRYRGPLPSGPR